MAGATRAANLLPDANGVWPAASFDEQVYYTNARLLAQGELPYRDHFLAHPPGVAYLLAPGLATQARWGGPGAFGAARQWLLLYSLLSIPLIFLVGRRLGGNLSGLAAAAVLAVDGRVAGVAVLETLVNCWSLAALLLYLYIPRHLPRRQRALWIVLCGACCAGAILTKVPGLAIALALPLHALFLRRPAVAAGLVASTAGGVLLGLAPFLILAPTALVRQTLFFQLLRPQEVRTGIDESLRIAAYPTSLLTTALAAAGLILLALALLRATALDNARKRPVPPIPNPRSPTSNLQPPTPNPRPPTAALARWLVVPLWATPVLAVFVVGRSYHAPYYVQWAPPLALLAGALLARPVRRALRIPRPARRWLAAISVPIAGLCLLPLFARTWSATFQVAPDTVYRPAAVAIQSLSSANDPVLSFDPGYAFVAGRPLAVIPGGGRLVDSAGYMTYSGLGIDRRSWGDLIGQVLQFDKARNAPAIFLSTAAQASVLGGLWTSRLAVVDGKIGRPQLRGQTLGLLEEMALARQDVEHVTIYGVNPALPSGYDFGTLQLRALTFEPLNPDGSGQGATLVKNDSEPTDVTLTAGQVLQLGCYWQAPAPAADARVLVRLVGPAGTPLVQTESAPDEDRAATSTWNPAFVYPDLRNVQIPRSAPPGAYRVWLGVSPAGQPATPVAVPASITVLAGR